MKTVLIVGGNGFIGRHTSRRLAASGWRVFATHRADSKRPSIPHVNWLSCDLAGSEPTAGWPRRVDGMIFLAQSSAWRSFPAGSDDVFRINIAALMESLAYAQRAGVQCFVYASSGSIFGSTQQPVSESTPVDLLNLADFYAASKLAGEVLLRPFQSVFATTVVRLFMPYGFGQNASMLFPRLVESVRDGLPIRLHGHDGLRANPVAIADVALALERCLHLGASCTLNVAGPEQLSLRAIGETIGEVVGRAPVFECREGEPGPVFVGDTALLAAALGWTPTTRLEAGLQQWLAEEAEQEDDPPTMLRFPGSDREPPACVG